MTEQTAGSRCRYMFRNNTSCREPAGENSNYCFWHDPETDKSGMDIKSLLEEKYRNGEPLEGFQLEGADLSHIRLIKADMADINLKKANLKRAHFYGSNLSGACLFKATLNKANLKRANLKGVELLGASLARAELEGVSWGKKNKIRNEIEAERLQRRGETEKAQEKYFEAEEIYRNIKTSFKNRGLGAEAGVYFHREMVMKRMQMPLLSIDRFWSFIMDYSTGYGEKPYKILIFSIISMMSFALIFSVVGIHHSSGELCIISPDNTVIENIRVLFQSLYFSVITFTTLGYGDYIPTSEAGRLLAMIEAFGGDFLLALLVITVYKSYMER
jgi:hypothetical protein